VEEQIQDAETFDCDVDGDASGRDMHRGRRVGAGDGMNVTRLADRRRPGPGPDPGMGPL
jgi:hypothetical protein